MSQRQQRLPVSTLLALVAVAVVPLAVATGFSNFERARQVVLAGLAAMSLVVWGVEVIRHRRVRVASPGTLAIGASFVAMVVGSVAWSGVWKFGTISAVMWASLGAIFLVLAAPTGKRGVGFLDWATAVGAGAIGAAGLGIYDALGGTALNPVWDPAGVAGGFDGIVFAALFYVLALPLLVAGVALSKGARRVFLGVALAGSAVHLAMVVPGVMLAMTAVVMAAMAAVVAGRRRTVDAHRLKVAAGAGLLALVIGAGGWMAMDRPDRESVADDLPRVVQSTDDLDEMARHSDRSFWYFDADRMEAPLDLRYRSYLQSVSRGLWSQEPLVGHGAGGWWLKQTDVIDDSDPVVRSMFERYPAFRSPHSDPARILVEQGIIGISLWVLFLLSLITVMVGGWKGLKGRREASEEGELNALAWWGLSSTVVLGAALSVIYPVLELGSSAVLWVGSAAVLLSVVGAKTDGRWSRTVEARPNLGVAVVVGVVAALAAALLMVPTVLNAKAGLERGHGDHLMLRGQFSQAIEAYESAHETYPAHADVLYNKSLAYRQTGRSIEGFDALDEALVMRPHDARYVTDYTRIMFLQQHIDTALVAGEEATRLGPNYLPAYEVLSATLVRRARYQKVADLQRAIMERQPPSEEYNRAKRRYAIIHGDHLGDPEKAVELLEEVIEEVPFDEERELLRNRIDAFERQIEREKLEEQGLPIPPELEEHHHDHDHDHDHGPFDHLRDSLEHDVDGDLPDFPSPGDHDHDHSH